MIFTLDIETIRNAAMVPFLPEPEISKVLKDPAKIAAARAEAKLEQMSRMALDPMTGRVCACALVGVDGAEDFSSVAVATGTDDECELALLAMIFTALGRKDARIVTYNGMGFDIPFLYKRAMILGLQLGEYGARALAHVDAAGEYPKSAAGDEGHGGAGTHQRLPIAGEPGAVVRERESQAAAGAPRRGT